MEKGPYTDEEVVVCRDAARANKGREEGESGEGPALHCFPVVHRRRYWDGDEEVMPSGGVDEFEK